MNAISVCQPQLADLERLAPMFDQYRQFYGRPSDVEACGEFLRNRLSRDDSALFMAWTDEVPVGFLQLYPSFSSVSLARIFVLNDLFVHPQARRQGVASRLISAAIEFARSSGAIRVSLSTAISNESAQALYQSLGWKRDQEFLVYHFGVPA
jgi:ribosomal protein S18 acetylase RimI-like enzyme